MCASATDPLCNLGESLRVSVRRLCYCSWTVNFWGKEAASVCLCDTVQSRWAWQGLCGSIQTQCLCFYPGFSSVPWGPSLTGVSGVYLLFCHTHPAEPFWQLEQTGADGCHKGNLRILGMLFSAHQSQSLKMVTEGLGINQTLSKACFCFSVLSSPVTMTICLGKVWGNMVIPVVCLESSHVW